MRKPESPGCGGDCACCPQAALVPEGGLEGGRLVLLALALFLFPLLAALAGALLAGKGGWAQLAGGAGGFLGSVLLLKGAFFLGGGREG